MERLLPVGEERLSILIVDDAIEPSDALVRLLLLDGFEVECAPTGTAGLERGLTRAHDAIVLDLHLPDILGLTVLRELRHAGVRTPVVTVTGWYGEAGHAATANALSAQFLRKPLVVEDLVAAIRHARSVPVGAFTAYTPPPERMRSQPHIDIRKATGRMSSRALHERALSGDSAAMEEIAESHLAGLRRSLQCRFPTASTDLINDAVVDAFLEYSNEPSRFDPSRGLTLGAYLLWSSRRNLQNLLDRVRRRSTHEFSVSDPELFEHAPRRAVSDMPGVDIVSLAAHATAHFSAVERGFVRLRLEGERRTSEYARVTGIEHMSVEAQRIAVKRIHDRISRRLRRYGLLLRGKGGPA